MIGGMRAPNQSLRPNETPVRSSYPQAVKTKWDAEAAASFGEESSAQAGFPQHGAGLPQMA